jgi:hypothetical protein
MLATVAIAIIINNQDKDNPNNVRKGINTNEIIVKTILNKMTVNE